MKTRSFCLWLALCGAMVWGLVLPPSLHSQQPDAKSSPSPIVTDQEPELSPALKDALKSGWESYTKRQDDSARQQLRRAVTLAREERNAWGEGEAHRILGLIASREAKYPESQAELGQALALFKSVPSSPKIALVRMHLGVVANYLGKRSEAIELYRQSLSEYEELHDLTSQAMVLQNLVMVDTLPTDQKRAYMERGLNLARELGNKSLAGTFLHDMGDVLFMAGDYAGAIEKLNEAAASLEEAGDRAELATVWTSLGRLQRAQGSYPEAIPYYQKGLSIQQELGDKLGVIQSLNAMAVAYGEAGDARESKEHYERALALARETGSPRVIAFMTGNVGATAAENGNYQRAIELLEECLRLDPSSSYLALRYKQLSRAYRGAQQDDRALECANKSVNLLRKADSPELLYVALQERADVYADLKRYPEALTDTEDAIHAVEQVRSKLVPADYLKQGYARRTQDLFASAIQLHERLGQHPEAMITAEEARARAFLDLLATRSVEQSNAQGSASAASIHAPADLSPQGKATPATFEAGGIGLATRGSAPLLVRAPSSAAALPSSVSASPPTFEEFVSTAKRLDSTLLSYWVLPDATLVWALGPDGEVRSERVAVTSEKLAGLIRAASYGEEEPGARPATSGAKGKTQTEGAAPSAPRGPQTLRLRGGGELVLAGSREQYWRELYKLLILPVQDCLPPRGGHLTIVPQGPLFRLSFAALQDAQGHYLVENYALNYAPSLGVLRFTGERKQRLGQRAPHYLVVADPQMALDLSKGMGLPPLPGAREEARNLVRLLPPGETTLLMGGDASKLAVRQQVGGKTVLHLATHAIVRDDQPMDSFLVLSAGDQSPPESGRLTVQEIYGMDLETDLVVLSACRTALGKLSGDGMVGLTRAFFYAGAPSVMATLWDVADEPTSQLVSSFYSSLQKDHDKSRALQTAQLRLLRALRAGHVHVDTPVGPITLPEDPVFWAGFVLQGEP